jgi:ATP-dependent DNA helicase RecG
VSREKNAKSKHFFMNRKTVNITLNATENQVLAIIRERPSITAEKLTELTSKTIRTAKRNLASLKNKGVIRRIGSDKTGYWEINKTD